MRADKILADLRREREQIEQAVLSLERLAAGERHKKSQQPSQIRKRLDDLDDGSSEGSSGGSAGVRSPLRPRRPPKTGRAGAALELDSKLADAVATYRGKRTPTDFFDAA
jgi:hypothetical protein